MKKTIQILLTAVLFLPALFSNATIVVVTQIENTFSPQDIEVKVGDTVRWVWTSGLHTTTSSTIPDGADAWDNLLSTDERQFDYVIKVAGLYNYVCTPHIALGMVGTITATSTLSIGERKPIAAVNLYPNPAKEHAVLQLSAEKSGIGTVAIYDLVGNQINKFDVAIRVGSNNVTIPVESFKPGVYFVELKYNNQVALVRRLVRSR